MTMENSKNIDKIAENAWLKIIGRASIFVLASIAVPGAGYSVSLLTETRDAVQDVSRDLTVLRTTYDEGALPRIIALEQKVEQLTKSFVGVEVTRFRNSDGVKLESMILEMRKELNEISEELVSLRIKVSKGEGR